MKKKELDFTLLCRSIACIETEAEAAAFLEDICTLNEMLALQQRLSVARLLSQGEIYSSIVEKTGASTATISRVNRCLQYGSDGYRIALDRLFPESGGEK